MEKFTIVADAGPPLPPAPLPPLPLPPLPLPTPPLSVPPATPPAPTCDASATTAARRQCSLQGSLCGFSALFQGLTPVHLSDQSEPLSSMTEPSVSIIRTLYLTKCVLSRKVNNRYALPGSSAPAGTGGRSSTPSCTGRTAVWRASTRSSCTSGCAAAPPWPPCRAVRLLHFSAQRYTFVVRYNVLTLDTLERERCTSACKRRHPGFALHPVRETHPHVCGGTRLSTWPRTRYTGLI